MFFPADGPVPYFELDSCSLPDMEWQFFHVLGKQVNMIKLTVFSSNSSFSFKIAVGAGNFGFF